MTDITTSPAAVNGNGTASQQKFRLLDAVHNDRRLSRADVCVAYFIINLFNPDKGYAWPSQETLAELTGLNLRTVKRAVGRLVRFGIVTITFRGRPGRSNEYVPVFVKGVRADTPLRTKGDSADTLMECALDSGQFQAAVLTGCWAWRSSYCAGLR